MSNMGNNPGFVGHDPNQVAQYGIAIPAQQQQQQPTLQNVHHHHRHHSLVGWTAHPVTAYHLVPMDGNVCGGCQPMFAHQEQHQHQYQQMPQQHISQQHMSQQQQQQPTIYAFPQNIAVQQMQNMPPMTPLSPITPMSPGSGLSPIRRQPLFGNGSFYHPSPSQYQQFPTPGHQQQQQQQFFQTQPQGQHHQHNHQLQRSQSIPVMSSQVFSGSPEVPRAFHLSPLRRAPEAYSPNMVFATPQPMSQPQPRLQPATHARNPARNQDNGDVFMDNPAVQAQFPLLATRQASFMNHRPNKPKPLALSQSNLHSHRDVDENNNGPGRFQSAAQLAAHRRKPVSSASTGALPYVPSVTPVGSDREYDGGGSSYSTSPLGSEAQARIRARMRIPFVPRNLRQASASVKAGGHPSTKEVTANALLAAPVSTLSTQPESSLEQFLQDHIHSIEANYADDKEEDVETNRKDAGDYRMFSSSDEWYTTSSTDPIRSRHRHHVVETHPVDHDNDNDNNNESSASGVGICDCGMQQCCRCRLFISRPETHTCMAKKAC